MPIEPGILPGNVGRSGGAVSTGGAPPRPSNAVLRIASNILGRTPIGQVANGVQALARGRFMTDTPIGRMISRMGGGGATDGLRAQPVWGNPQGAAPPQTAQLTTWTWQPGVGWVARAQPAGGGSAPGGGPAGGPSNANMTPQERANSYAFSQAAPSWLPFAVPDERYMTDAEGAGHYPAAAPSQKLLRQWHSQRNSPEARAQIAAQLAQLRSPEARKAYRRRIG